MARSSRSPSAGGTSLIFCFSASTRWSTSFMSRFLVRTP
jgi:hypothetical protein